MIVKQAICNGHRFISKRNFSDKVVGLIGILEDRNGSYRQGPSKAPPIIRQHFFEPAVNTWSELGIEVSERITDFGDFTPESRTHDDIFRSIGAQIDILQRVQGLVPLTLGGDHSITFATSKAVRKFIGKPLVIVHFDAHNDIYDSYEGDGNSHACPFARICEIPDLCEQLISIGIRTLNGEQKIQIQKFGVNIIEAKDFPAKGSDIKKTLDTFIGFDTPVYISFDIDVLEPG
jgi:arginase family enzyme